MIDKIPMDAKQHAFLDHPVVSEGPMPPATDPVTGQPLPPPVDPVTGQPIPQNANATLKVEFEGGGKGVYKPLSGENPGLKAHNFYDDFYRNEVGAYHVDQALGFGRVPTTTAFNGSLGPGSIQAWSAGKALDGGAAAYDVIQQQQMGVLDYILGNGDRHPANWMTMADGGPAAIDNGMAFPNANAEAMRSDFIKNVANQPLNQTIVDAVKGVDQTALAQQLKAAGISDAGIKGAMSRLNEIAGQGQISGSAWTQTNGGYFLSSDMTEISIGGAGSWQPSGFTPPP